MNFGKKIKEQRAQREEEIQEIVQSEEKMQSLLDRAMSYLTINRSHVGGDLIKSVGTLSRLSSAYLTGKYKDISTKSLSLIAFGLLYFISPIDIIPDYIIPFGFMDDAFVLGWVIKQITGELTKFRSWERIEEGREQVGDFTGQDVKHVFLIGGWFSQTADYKSHTGEIAKIYPCAKVEHFLWDANGSWDESRDNADGLAPEQLIKRLEPLTQQNSLQKTVLIGHSLGGRAVVRTLAKLHQTGQPQLYQAILMGAAINNDDPEISDAVLQVQHDIFNFYSKADGVLRYLYQGYHLKEALGLSGSAKEIPGLRNIKVSGTEEHIYGLVENVAQLQTILRGKVPLYKLQEGKDLYETFGNWNKHHFLEYIKFFHTLSQK